MDQLTRTAEAPAPVRNEAPAAPRGAELQRASDRFAELLGKPAKESRTAKSARDPRADGAEGFVDAGAERLDAFDRVCGRFHMPGERGDAQQQPRQSPQEAMGFAELATPAPERSPAISAWLAEPSRDIDAPRFLDPPVREEGLEAPGLSERFLGLVERQDRHEGHGSGESDRRGNDAQPEPRSPTPGELLLQAFGRPAEAQPAAPTEAARFDRVANVDAIQQLGDQVAERILVSAAETGGATEMLIQLKDVALPGTEVRIVHDGARLQVTFTTDHAASFDLLAARQAELQTRLGDHVTVQLAFDPEGLVSRQRLERTDAAGAGEKAGDDRGRERDPDGRSRDRRRGRDTDEQP